MSGAQRTNSPAGVALMLGSSVMFGVIFFLAGVVNVPWEHIIAWRVLITLACYAAMLCVPRCRSALKNYLSVVRAQRAGWVIVAALSCLVTVQLWLFVWAPVTGHALDVALGYLLLPLVLVVAGRFVFHDRMTKLQWIAVSLATVAVLAKTIIAGGMAWPVLVVAAGYTLYFMVRRHTRFDATPGFGVEMALMSPVMIWLLLSQPVAPVVLLDAVGVVAIALVGTLAMFLYLGSSVRLTMPVFGLLSYVEPVLLLVVALILGEVLAPGDAAVYGLLTVALAILSVDGFRQKFARG